MQKSITNKRLAMALCAGVVALLIVALTAVAGGAAEFGGDKVPVESSRPLTIGTPGTGTAKFNVLRPATAAGARQLPVTVQTVLANPPASAAATKGTVTAFGSRAVGVGASQIGVAEVDGVLCVFAAGSDYQGAAVGNCLTLAEAETGEGYVAVPDLSPNSVRIVGVVPNGVASLAVDSGEDGTVDRTVSVGSNLYQVDLAEVPTTIAGLTKSGEQAFKIQLPLDQFAG